MPRQYSPNPGEGGNEHEHQQSLSAVGTTRKPTHAGHRRAEGARHLLCRRGRARRGSYADQPARSTEQTRIESGLRPATSEPVVLRSRWGLRSQRPNATRNDRFMAIAAPGQPWARAAPNTWPADVGDQYGGPEWWAALNGGRP